MDESGIFRQMTCDLQTLGECMDSGAMPRVNVVRQKRVLILFGTRPEVIKLAPVVRALRRKPLNFETRIVSTGQHREMVQQALNDFGLEVDVQLDAMSSGKSLGRLTAWLFDDIDQLLEIEMPDWIIVQGDTTSAMTGAICAFYRRIKVAHVEAGLRTHNRWSPFPEEINRTFISHVADLHFAPTQRSAGNLRDAGVPEEAIHVTGNTVVDALLWASEGLKDFLPAGIDPEIHGFIEGKRMILVTSHRRESFGEGLESICRGLLGTVERFPDAVIIYPVHLNPDVCGPVYRLLGGHPNIKLLKPVGYLGLVWLMKGSYCIFTDSGGIQEEAPSLGKPVLIMRDTTERPEVLEAGCARLVGASGDSILSAVCELFENREVYEGMAHAKNPFGDGCAADRIAEVLRLH
jgi:UDP-N-acetylglucosamine 2-epimerase (non-hydrolysing)